MEEKSKGTSNKRRIRSFTYWHTTIGRIVFEDSMVRHLYSNVNNLVEDALFMDKNSKYFPVSFELLIILTLSKKIFFCITPISK